MLEHEGAQNHHAGAQVTHLSFRIEIAYAFDTLIAVGIDAKHLRAGSQIEIAGLERHRNRRVKRRRLGMNVAAVKIAMTAINAGGPFRNARVERLGRTIRPGQNSCCSLVGMITKLPACFREEFHPRTVAQRRQRKAPFARACEWVGARFTGNTELPLEALVIRFEIVVAQRPIDNIVAGKVSACALRIAAFDLVSEKSKVPGHVARRLAGSVQQCATENIERTRAVLEPAFVAGFVSGRRGFVTHPFQLLGTNQEANRIPRRIVFELRRRAALEPNDFQSSGGELFRHNSAQPTHSHNAYIACVRLRLRHFTSPAVWANSPTRALDLRVC